MADSVDPDQTAPIGAVCSESTLFASILNSSVILGNYLQQTTSADDIFRCLFFLGALMVNEDLNENCYPFSPTCFSKETYAWAFYICLFFCLSVWQCIPTSHFNCSETIEFTLI